MRIVAVIGASSNRRKFGNKALRAFAHQGFTVIPINPHETAVKAIARTPRCSTPRDPIDMATLYVHADAGIRG